MLIHREGVQHVLNSLNMLFISGEYINSIPREGWCLQLPYRTHNTLLHLISKDQSIDVQLHLRIMKYVMSNLKSTNSLVRLSTQLCMSGSKSLTCKSINHIM